MVLNVGKYKLSVWRQSADSQSWQTLHTDSNK